MAYTKFKGQSVGITLGAALTACGGVTEVTISDKGGPDVAQEDTTSAPASVYEFTADPLGVKGKPSCTVTVNAFKDRLGVATGGWYKAATIAMGTSYACAIEPSGSVATNTTWSHTGLRMTTRVTTLNVEDWAKCTYTLESATDHGAWGQHA